MASSPDLFVVCKNCGSQVSPYITECPYCGTRIRKRAPKIERGDDLGPPGRRRRTQLPSLGPLRTGEIPGLRGDEFRRPYVTIALIVAGALWWLAIIPLRDEGFRIVLDPLGEWWQVLTAPFVHLNSWYQFAALGSVAIFGWLLERKHGWLPMLAVWFIGASGSLAIVKAVETDPFAMGASYGALALLCAWAVPILLERRRVGDSDYDDADMIGAGVIFVLLVLMPAARPEVDWIATAAGVVLGSLCGLLISRVRPER
jgi:membrane associated rhomboid family serine protease